MLSTVHEFLIVLAAILLRLLVGIWSYSGCHDPPMFGDFEAQRHWMEITSSLKIGDWYRNTSENDLNYWGLDYPPLTAYVSWVFGILARRILPELVYPISSHGYETEDGKFFMRMSVIATDVIVLFPSVIVAVRSFARHDEVMNAWHILISLLIPSLILIDHGHFQYNGVCLGFALLGAVLIVGNHDILGSILFCFSLNFKQMSLYYAPVFFFVLLRKCWLKPNFYLKLRKFIELGLTVLGTFSILWFPFCAFHAANENCFSSLLAVLSRQFPFSRGIFEDKVSNLWYAASVLFEFRGIFTPGQLVAASIFLTIVLLTPICTYLVIHPVSLRGFLLSMIGSALAYFLASYQVLL